MQILSAVFAVVVFLGTPSFSAPQATFSYQVVILRRNPSRVKLADADAEKLQAAHMANIRGMAAAGLLVAAGPMDDQPPVISGLFVMKASTLAVALEAARKDPTVVANRNAVEGFTWHGPSGLGDEYRRLHQLDPETPENMQMHPVCFVSQKQRQTNLSRLHETDKVSALGTVEPGADGPAALVVFRSVPLTDAMALMRVHALDCEWHQWWVSEHVLPK